MAHAALPVIAEGTLRQLYHGFTKRLGSLSAFGTPSRNRRGEQSSFNY